MFANSRQEDPRCVVAKRFAFALLLGTSLLAGAPAALAADTFRNVGGFAIYLGVLPAPMLRGHAPGRPELKMHRGPPAGRDQQHVVIAVFDAATGARIEDAEVTAKVAEPGLSVVEKRLEPMPIAGAMSYGNYFAMPAKGPYRIDVHIARPATGRAVDATFMYTLVR